MISGIYEEIINNKILKEINSDGLIIGKEKLDVDMVVVDKFKIK